MKHGRKRAVQNWLAFQLMPPQKRALIFLFADDDIILVLINTVFGDDATNAACGVNACASAKDRAGVKNAVAAYLDTIAEDSADSDNYYLCTRFEPVPAETVWLLLIEPAG